jgi:hypothetical protein
MAEYIYVCVCVCIYNFQSFTNNKTLKVIKSLIYLSQVFIAAGHTKFDTLLKAFSLLLPCAMSCHLLSVAQNPKPMDFISVMRVTNLSSSYEKFNGILMLTFVISVLLEVKSWAFSEVHYETTSVPLRSCTLTIPVLQLSSLTMKAVFSAWSMQSGYEEVFSTIDQ